MYSSSYKYFSLWFLILSSAAKLWKGLILFILFFFRQSINKSAENILRNSPWTQPRAPVRSTEEVAMVLYWKLLTIVTNMVVIDVNREPGFTSALLLFLPIMQFVMKLMNFTLRRKLTISCLLLLNLNVYLLSRCSLFVGTFFHSIWVYWG